MDEEIFLLDGAGFDSNVYCINNEILVDCGSGLFLKETLEQMREYGVEPKKIKTIILTHAHFDHVGGAKSFKEKTGAKLFIHKDDKPLLKTGEGVLANLFKAKYNPPEIDETFEGGEKIPAGKYNFEVLHTPGHTPGSICLWDKKNKILISGDTLFLDGVGKATLPNGDEEKLNQSLKKLKNLDIEVLLPGHGSPASRNNIYSRNVIKKMLEKL